MRSWSEQRTSLSSEAKRAFHRACRGTTARISCVFSSLRLKLETLSGHWVMAKAEKEAEAETEEVKVEEEKTEVKDESEKVEAGH